MNTNYDDEQHNDTQVAGDKNESFITSVIDTFVDPLMEAFGARSNKNSNNKKEDNTKAIATKKFYQSWVFWVGVFIVGIVCYLLAMKFGFAPIPDIVKSKLPFLAPSTASASQVGGLTTINDITVTPQA